MDGKRIGELAVGGGDIGLDGVGDGVHTGVGHQLLGHGLRQLRVNDGHVRGDLEVGDGVLDALFIVGDDGERRDLGGCAGGGGHRAEMRLFTQLGDAEDLAHILEGALGILILDPHGLRRVDGGAAADCHDPIRLELGHDLCALHNGLHGGVGLNALKELDLHAGLFQILLRAAEKAAALHGAAADADDRLFAFKGLERFQRALTVINVSGESKTCHIDLISFFVCYSGIIPCFTYSMSGSKIQGGKRKIQLYKIRKLSYNTDEYSHKIFFWRS